MRGGRWLWMLEATTVSFKNCTHRCDTIGNWSANRQHIYTPLERLGEQLVRDEERTMCTGQLWWCWWWWKWEVEFNKKKKKPIVWFANAERIAPISAMELWEQLPGRRRHRADGEFKLKRRGLIKGGKLVVSHIRQKKNLTVIDPHGPEAEEWVCRKLEWRGDQNHFSLICWFGRLCLRQRNSCGMHVIWIGNGEYSGSHAQLLYTLTLLYLILCHCFRKMKWTFYVWHLIFD